MAKTNDRISSVETRLEQPSCFAPLLTCDDEISLLALSDNDLEDGLSLATEPQDKAVKATQKANKPSHEANKPSHEATRPSSQTSVSHEEDQLKETSNNSDSALSLSLYDPDSALSSWAPQKDFSSFLEKQFRRKLTYDQVCEILDNYNIPAVDCLFTPSLDPSIANQISPPQTKKYVQDRDKEMATVQRAFLNTTGPLCSLHDALTSGTQVPIEDIKTIVEQTLCLLGSANHQMSVLRRKKVLANINKDKVSLAEQPLPNAKRFLFGEDFPTVASKQAELSRGLAKNLSHVQKPKQTFHKSVNTKDRQRPKTSGTFSKYQANRPKNYRSFRPNKGPSNQDSTTS